MTLDEFFNFATRLSITESLNEKPDLTEYEMSQWLSRYNKMDPTLAPNTLFNWSLLYTLHRYVKYWQSTTASELERPV